MKLALSYFYWHQKIGPIELYSYGKFPKTEEDLLFWLSSNKGFISSTQSSISGPFYYRRLVIMCYHRVINTPDAKDKRLRLLGTDCWVLLATQKKYELLLQSKIDIIKMVLDIEFESITELYQLTAPIADQTTKAICQLFYLEDECW
jgi:hypothetical protein